MAFAVDPELRAIIVRKAKKRIVIRFPHAQDGFSGLGQMRTDIGQRFRRGMRRWGSKRKLQVGKGCETLRSMVIGQ